VNRNVLVLIFLAGMAVSCSSRTEAPAAEAAIPVRMGGVRRIHAAQTVPVSGSVVSWKDPSNVAFVVSGKVVEAGPREGDAVAQGQVLARIDPADYTLAVEAAEAQLAAAVAVLEKADAPARPEVLEQARDCLRAAQDEYRRMKQLFDSKSLAPNDFRKYEAAYEAAGQQYKQAQAGAQKEDRAQARAARDAAAAALGLARKRLADATLRSPWNGFVSSRSVQVGRDGQRRARRFSRSWNWIRWKSRGRAGDRHSPGASRADGGGPGARAAWARRSGRRQTDQRGGGPHHAHVHGPHTPFPTRSTRCGWA
jgi:multidrug efflux pump subunit AcrA (membrane-fusion protein)